MVALNAEIDEVLQRVANWPADARASLANRLLATLKVKSGEQRVVRGSPAKAVLGMLANGSPPPNDDECQQILEEELIRKHLK